MHSLSDAYILTIRDNTNDSKDIQYSLSNISLDLLHRVKKQFEETWIEPDVDLYTIKTSNLRELTASVLVLRYGADRLTFNGASDYMYLEQDRMPYKTDTRYELCFAEGKKRKQVGGPEGRGRTICFRRVPLLERLKNALLELLEMNEGTDVRGKKYLGKRNFIVLETLESSAPIIICLGKSMKLRLQWYRDTEPISNNYEIHLQHGDIVLFDKAINMEKETSLRRLISS